MTKLHYNKGCIGCLDTGYCIMPESKIQQCPCLECLVKPMCTSGCDEFTYFQIGEDLKDFTDDYNRRL